MQLPACVLWWTMPGIAVRAPRQTLLSMQTGAGRTAHLRLHTRSVLPLRLQASRTVPKLQPALKIGDDVPRQRPAVLTVLIAPYAFVHQSAAGLMSQAASLLEVRGNAVRRHSLSNTGRVEAETVLTADAEQYSQSLLDQAKGAELL